MELNIGDIIEFPNHEQSTLIGANTASITLSQGAPGKWRVVSKTEESTVLKKVKDD